MDPTDRYFLEKLAEQRRAKREELELAAKEERVRLKLSEALATDDEALVQRVRALGFDGDSARVFDLLPLIHVAWADGTVQHAERAQILDILTLRGIEPEDEAWIFVSALLEQQPSSEYIQLTLELLRDVLKHSGRNPSSIVEMCANVASAAGGFLGFGSAVSNEERVAIEAISQALQVDEKKSLQSLLG